MEPSERGHLSVKVQVEAARITQYWIATKQIYSNHLPHLTHSESHTYHPSTLCLFDRFASQSISAKIVKWKKI